MLNFVSAVRNRLPDRYLRASSRGLVLAFAILQPCEAITGRHDVAPSVFAEHSADKNYAAAGLVRGGTTCAVAGGVLINPEWVLTAAHCLPASTSQEVSFHLGVDESSLEISVAADDWFRHSAYNGNVANGHDLGLIRLAEPILDVTPSRVYRGSNEIGLTATIVGYGHAGDGETGDVLPRGVRRAGENVLDRTGMAMGFSPDVLLTDFDSPDDRSGLWGSDAPLAMEAAVSRNDSGSPWFINDGGVTSVAAISSFRTASDGLANSDYHDVSAGLRVSREQVWLDSNHDRTLFANDVDESWQQAATWETGLVPSAGHTVVIDRGTIRVESPHVASVDAAAKFVILDGDGALRLSGPLSADELIVRSEAALQVDGHQRLDSDLEIEAGSIELALRQLRLRDSDHLEVDGRVGLGGRLEIRSESQQADDVEPTKQGTAYEFALISTRDVDGAFESIRFDEAQLELGSTHVGSDDENDQGRFLSLVWRSSSQQSQLVLTNYLAIPGDANGDLRVDASDYDIWQANRFLPERDWTHGDFNSDGQVDSADFAIWAQNDGSVAVILTPEPSAWLLCLLGLMAASRFRTKAVRVPS